MPPSTRTRPGTRTRTTTGYSNGVTNTTSCTRPAGYKTAAELTATSGDCSDSDVNRHPGAAEVCNGIDDDCDGATDEGLALATYYRDADNDGYGDPAVSTQSCSVPSGYVTDNTDCNDANAAEHPGQTWYQDADNDGYSNGVTNTTSCTRPAGYRTADELTATSGDCSDSDANRHPGATEVCNGIDDDCDGATDEGACTTCDRTGFTINGQETAMYDPGMQLRIYNAEGSVALPTDILVIEIFSQRTGGSTAYPGTYTIPAVTNFQTSHTIVETQVACTANSGCAKMFVAVAGTLNVTSFGVIDGRFAGSLSNVVFHEATVGPGGVVTEVPGGETWCIESHSFDVTVAAFDGDGDGVPVGPDCDDTNPNIYPGATEICGDGIDQDCDGSDLACTGTDVDQDGYTVEQGDCNDANPAIHPGATEICGNGIDEDCNGSDLACGSEVVTGNVSLTSSAYDNNQGYIFSSQTVISGISFVPNWNAGDFYIEDNLLIPAASAGLLDLGPVGLNGITSVPAVGYLSNNVLTPQTGHVYAFALADGKYAAIEFTEVAFEVEANGTYPRRSTFNYKYLLPAAGGGTTPDVSVINNIKLTSYGWDDPNEVYFEGFNFDVDPQAAAVVSNTDSAVDFYVEWNSIWMGANTGIQSLGNTVPLADITTVPPTGYTDDGFSIEPFASGGDNPTGYVYALKLSDGTYAAIVFEKFGFDDGTNPPYSIFHYKYPLTAVDPPPSNVLSGTITLKSQNQLTSDAFTFATQGVTQTDLAAPWTGPADLTVSGESLFLSYGSIADIGVGDIATTTSVPEFGYMPFDHAAYGSWVSPTDLDHVYAIHLGSGQYAAIQFTEINVPTGVEGETRCTFKYKYQSNGTTSLQ